MRDLAAITAPRPATLLDRLDPRTRILGALALVLTASRLQDPAALAILLLAAAGVFAIATCGARWPIRRLVQVEGFVLVLVVLLPLTVPGETIVRIGPFAVSAPGAEKAVLLAFRINIAAMAVPALVAGIEPVRFGHALGRLGLPPALVHILLFSIRYVGLIGAEAGRLHDAMRARGFRPAADAHGVRTLAALAGRVVVRSLDRADRVDAAMRCRGYTGRLALVADGRFGSADGAFLAALSVLVAVAASIGALR